MKALHGFACLAALLIATPAAATDWYAIAETSDASSASFIDKDSIRAAGEGMMQAQLYLVYAENRTDGTAAMDMLMEFDCRQPRSRFLRLVGYDETQRKLNDDPGSGQWSSVPGNSQAIVIREFVCSGGRSVAASASHGAVYPFTYARARLARHRAEDAQRH